MSNKRRKPYRTPDRSLPLPGVGNTQDVGFVQTAQGSLAQLKKRVAGLRDRLRFKYSDGVPTAYVGEKVFKPEAATFEVESDRVGYNGAPIGGTSTVQYVVRDGVTHTVPVVIPGPGVFMARYMNVTFYQRIYGGADNEYQLNDLTHKTLHYTLPWGKSFFNPANSNRAKNGQLPPQTGKISLLRRWYASAMPSDRNQIGINFFWNLTDRDSDRRVSEDLVPHDVLLPQGFQGQVSGDLFEFAVPWLFERAGRLDFDFRLINPILQLAASSPVFPLLHEDDFGDVWWDDLEQDGTVRNQEVKVRVELHGTKFYSERDRLLRESA